MAADRAAPWSRWDDYTPAVPTPFPGGRPVYDQPGLTNGQNQFIRSALVDQRVNSIDPSFFDCYYGIANSANTVIERCYKDIGCCATGCCKDTDWQTKYGWAVALIVIFCIIVIIAVVLTLIIWLICRAKDKNQKRQLLQNGGISPASSQMSLTRPIQGGYHFGTGPYQNPPGSGYRY